MQNLSASIDLGVQQGREKLLREQIRTIDLGHFCILITKKWGIQADSGALYLHLGIKVTWSLHYD